MATTDEKTQRKLSSVPEMRETIDDTSDQSRYLLLFSLSPEMNEAMEELAARNGIDKAEVLNMAVGILKFLSDQVRQGKKVGVASPGQKLETAITDI